MRGVMRRAFSLLEVNLAILVMGGGIVSVAALYSLGFRENDQAREDVATSAFADRVLGPLAMALSDTNLTWKAFNSVQTLPDENGWGSYFKESDSEQVVDNPTAIAQRVYAQVVRKISAASGISAAWPAMPETLGAAGLVVKHEPGSPIIHLALRASNMPRALISAPLYYTAVAFQGRQASEEDEEESK